MAMPANKKEPPVEERIARLETHVEHIQSGITDIKGHLQRLEHKIDGVKDSLTHMIFEFQLSMEKRFTRLTIMGFTLYITLAGGLLAAMAKGFGWIG